MTSVMLFKSVCSFACPHFLQNFERLSPSPPKKKNNSLSSESNSSLSFEARCLSFFSMTLSINACTQILNFGLKLFYAWFWAKCSRKENFRFSNIKNKLRQNSKFYYRPMWRKVGGMPIRIKIELSSFETLGRDRFANFFQNIKISIFFKVKIGKSHKNKKVAELHYIITYQISEHRNQ